MKWKRSKKWTAILLSLLMVVSLLPSNVFGSVGFEEEELFLQQEDDIESEDVVAPETDASAGSQNDEEMLVADLPEEGQEELPEIIGEEPMAADITEDEIEMSEEEEPAGQTDFRYEDERMVVQLQLAPEDALPEGTQLQVALLDDYVVDETTSEAIKELKIKHDDIERLLRDVTDDNGNSVQGFEAYHLELVNGDTVYLPSREAEVSVTYKEAAYPATLPEGGAGVSEVKILNYTTVINGDGEVVTTLDDLSDKLTAFQFADASVGSVANYGFWEAEATDFVVAWCGAEAEKIVRFDYRSDEVNVLVTLTDPDDLPEHAQLIVEPAELTEAAQRQLEEAAIEEQKAIENVFAYDIRFEAEGKEVQPGDTVKVQVSIPEISAENDAAVYHVDSNDQVENMDGAVDEQGNVVFDTPHFSTYVIVQQGTNTVTVKLQHYDKAANRPIYTEDVKELTVGGRINNYAKAVNYNVDSVMEVLANGREAAVADINEIQVSRDTTLRIYYTAATKRGVPGDVTVYDYQIQPYRNNTSRGINANAHYRGTDLNNRMAAGTPEDGRKSTSAERYNAYGTNDKNANTYNGAVATLGLITGLSEDYETVLWKTDEPGFFTGANTAAGEGKQIYTNYKLKFQQTGNHYTLTSLDALDEDHEVVKSTAAGSNFYPIDDPVYDYKGSEHYFGLRYDIEFRLGDYIGPMNYSFTGDDDLWVLLDGEVVIDVGGIHDALTGEVDLWDVLEQKGYVRGELTEEQRNARHRLTVLYMERGAGESNCQMDFVLPETHFVDVTDLPKADLAIYKTNTQAQPLSGAVFQLTSDADSNEQYTVTTNREGRAVFANLREGSYTLTESMAPNGYIAETNKSWKVVVEADESAAEATLYEKDGVTPVEDNRIVNYTSQELISKNLQYDKTVQLTDWEEREYRIDLTAASLSSSTSTAVSSQPVDIMFVFDLSGSMNYKTGSSSNAGIAAVGRYASVKAGLDTTKTYYYGGSKSESTGGDYPDQPMIYVNGGWMYYGNRGWKSVPDTSTTTIYTCASRLTALKEAAGYFVRSTAESSPESKIGITYFSGTSSRIVASLDTVGSSEPVSLLQTINRLTANNGTYPSYGLDNALEELQQANDLNPKYVIMFSDGAPSSAGATREAEASAEELRENGYTVITIGLATSSENVEGYRNLSTSSWLAEYIASPGWAYTADTAEELKEIFADLETTITNTYDITGAQIVDIIDQRFELTEAEKTRLRSTGAEITENADGTTTVVWNDQTIPYNKDGAQWTQSIRVVAREEYIGGNDVTTNAEGSVINSIYGTAVLPQPTVNVKVDFYPGAEEDRIFLGESLENYFTAQKQNAVAGLNSVTGSAYTMLEDVTITTKWYRDEAGTQEVTAEQIKAEKPEDTTVYYAKITVTPKTDGTASGENMIGDGHAAEGYYRVVPDGISKDGTYTVKVVCGSVVIEKQVNKVDTAQGDAIFTFALKNEMTGITYYRTVRFNTSGRNQKKTAIIQNLPQGVYTVTELETIRYRLASTVLSGSGSYPANTADEKLYIGLKTGGTETDTDSRDGKAILVNVKENDNHYSDTDAVINSFRRGEDGKTRITGSDGTGSTN